MAISDLQTALTNIDAEILTLSSKMADPTSYTIESLTVTRAKMMDLIAARKALAELINADGTQIYQTYSYMIPG